MVTIAIYLPVFNVTMSLSQGILCMCGGMQEVAYLDGSLLRLIVVYIINLGWLRHSHHTAKQVAPQS